MQLPRFLAFVYLSATLVAATTPPKTPNTTPEEDCTSKSCFPCKPLQDFDPNQKLLTPLPSHLQEVSAKSNDPPNVAKDATKPATPKQGLAVRDIRHGWFTQSECEYLLKESEKGVNYWHLIDAIWEIRSVLVRNGVKWAVTGGFGLKLHGMMQRYTTDIDIVVDTSMQDLIEMFTGHDLFIVPGDWWGNAGPHLRIFFRYKRYRQANPNPTAPKYIEIDLIISGTLTTPIDLIGNSIDIAKERYDGRRLQIHTMQLGKIFKSKLQAMNTPSRANKHHKDMADANWILTEREETLINAATDIHLNPRMNYCNLLMKVNGYAPIVRKADACLGLRRVF